MGLIWIDLDVHRLPVGLVVPTGWWLVALLAVASVATGDRRWLGALIGAGVMGAVYLLLAVLPGGGVGGGDVRLAPVIGGLLGWLGAGALLVGPAGRVPRRGPGRRDAARAAAGGAAQHDRLRPGDVPRGVGRHRVHVPDPDLAHGRLRAAWKDWPHAALADRWGVARPCARRDMEGLPAGVEVTTADVAAALARRRLGYGRGARMKFEQDEVEFLGGVRHG